MSKPIDLLNNVMAIVRANGKDLYREVIRSDEYSALIERLKELDEEYQEEKKVDDEWFLKNLLEEANE